MSDRVCISCGQRYGERHLKTCPKYIEPTYTREMIEKFILDSGKKFIDPKNGVEAGVLLDSDLDQLEAKYY